MVLRVHDRPSLPLVYPPPTPPPRFHCKDFSFLSFSLRDRDGERARKKMLSRCCGFACFTIFPYSPLPSFIRRSNGRGGWRVRGIRKKVSSTFVPSIQQRSRKREQKSYVLESKRFPTSPTFSLNLGFTLVSFLMYLDTSENRVSPFLASEIYQVQK